MPSIKCEYCFRKDEGKINNLTFFMRGPFKIFNEKLFDTLFSSLSYDFIYRVS